jgi:type VII secretion-associated protein (TIGR03931 family)
MDHASIVVGTVCEIGPVQVRRLRSGADESVRLDPALVAAALDNDDPVVLVGTRAMALDEIWCALLEPLLGHEPALLVHPSWWSGPRIDHVRDVARRYAGDVITKPRSWLLGMVDGDAPVVEIGPQVVTVTVHGGAPSGFQRRARTPSQVAESVVRKAVQESGRSPVWLDAPAGVPGADALAGQIADRLRAAGRAVRWVDDRQLLSAAEDLTNRPGEPPAPPRRRHRQLLVAATAIATLTAGGAWAGTRQDDPVEPVPMTALVEGHVTMQIPADWAVRRITTGPGSARVEAMSPQDGESALHLTQAAVPDDSLAMAAATLRRAMDAEPAGIFVDFHPSDERAGRPAITYREIRPGHQIRWAVVLDGNVRIGIGCQSGAASADLTAACDEAVRSAHEIG